MGGPRVVLYIYHFLYHGLLESCSSLRSYLRLFFFCIYRRFSMFLVAGEAHRYLGTWIGLCEFGEVADLCI